MLAMRRQAGQILANFLTKDSYSGFLVTLGFRQKAQ